MKEADLSVHCTVECSDPDWHVDDNALKELVARICSSVDAEIRSITGVRNAVSLACYFVSAPEMRDLNRRHRDVGAVTDMLSFPLGFSAPGRGWVLGDIVVCMDAVEEKARTSGNTTGDQLSFSLSHSFLHLLGFDHVDDADRLRMEQREELAFATVEAVSHAGVVKRSA
jgi:probable rRNA maturation factor